MGLLGKRNKPKREESSKKRNIIKHAVKSKDLQVAVSHSDLEGMLSSIGIIAALVLSIQVGVFCTIPAEEMILADYRVALIEHPGFRSYVAKYLDTVDDFEWFVDLGGDEEFDIRSILMDDDICIAASDGGGFDCNLEGNKKKVLLADSVYHLTKDVFPMSRVIPFFYHTAENTNYILSGPLYDRWSSAAVCALTCVLLGSLIFYTALALSDCQEESEVGNQRPLYYFNIIAMPYAGERAKRASRSNTRRGNHSYI